MKKLLLLALLAMIMVGCKNIKNGDGTYRVATPPRTYIIDSCEYMGICEGGQSDFLAHKGNCRYCAERNRRMIREQVDSILTEIFD